MFHFNESAETIDIYVQRIRQVVVILNYGEPQILEVFENTMPLCLQGVLSPIEHLWQAVEMAKRILTKEKVDTQLAWQNTGASPF